MANFKSVKHLRINNYNNININNINYLQKYSNT